MSTDPSSFADAAPICRYSKRLALQIKARLTGLVDQ